MKNLKFEISKIFYTLLIIAFVATACSSPTETSASNYSDDLEKVLETMEIEDLSSEEADGLVFMREEEKLARDVYLTLYDKWDVVVFSNIARSEQKHTDAIKLLLDRYAITDPVTNDSIGVFQNDDLQALYNTLVAQGSESLEAALRVGAAIEEIDILDLVEQVDTVVDNEDIKLVYGNLTRGSRNHLRAFNSNLSSIGVDYTPGYLTQEQFDEIVNSEHESGGNGNGKRWGRG